MAEKGSLKIQCFVNDTYIPVDGTKAILKPAAGQEGESKEIFTLKDFNDEVVDMFSIVIIGNSKSYIKDGYFVTPRGYKIKK